MADNSAIEWTDATWNPVTGCTKIGPGCDHCYAERFAERWRGTPGHAYEQGFDLRFWDERLVQPARWRRSRMIFVTSMGDLFHKQVPNDYLDRVFDAMEETDRHIYQVLTKRSSRLASYVNRRYRDAPAPWHIWLGVSVEDRQRAKRIAHLQRANATIRFLSIEPLLGSIGPVDLTGISWVIVGGESGPGARKMEADWAREIRDQCTERDVAFFFKQWGGIRPKTGGRELDGRTHDGFPGPMAAC